MHVINTKFSLLGKKCVLKIKMWLFVICEKELRTICIWTTVCHRHGSTHVVLNTEFNKQRLLTESKHLLAKNSD